MSKDNIIKLIQPGNVDDQLTEILRNGARALLTQAVEAEVADFLGKHADLKTVDGHQRVVRHGHLPEREVMTGIGPVAVRQPRVRDRETDATDPDRIRFSPSILPPCMRRSKSIETFQPVLLQLIQIFFRGDGTEILRPIGGGNFDAAHGIRWLLRWRFALWVQHGPPSPIRRDLAAARPALGDIKLARVRRGAEIKGFIFAKSQYLLCFDGSVKQAIDRIQCIGLDVHGVVSVLKGGSPETRQKNSELPILGPRAWLLIPAAATRRPWRI